MGTFAFTREDAEIHFNVSISEGDWEMVEDTLSFQGDFGVEFTECLGGIRYEFDNSQVLEEMEYSRHEQIGVSSELEKYTYTHWGDIASFWETSIEIEVIAAIKSELETLGILYSENPIEHVEAQDKSEANKSEPSSNSDPWGNQSDNENSFDAEENPF